MRRIIPALTLLFLFTLCEAQYQYSPASNTALGSGVTAMPGFWAGQENPAAYASVDAVSIGIGYDNKYLLKELAGKFLSVAVPLKNESGILNFNASQFGISGLAQSQFSLGFSRLFGKKVSAGLEFSYLLISSETDQYDGAGLFCFDAGLQYQFNDNFRVGGRVSNLNNPQYGIQDNGEIPIIASTGIAYKISKYVLVVADVYQNSSSKATIRAGLDYKINKEVHFRIGYLTNPGQLSFGFGFIKNNFAADVVTQWHQTLGFSPGLSLRYSLGKTKKQNQWF